MCLGSLPQEGLSSINYDKVKLLCRQPVAFAAKASDTVKNIQHQREKSRGRRGASMQEHKMRFDVLKLVQAAQPEEW